MISVHNAGDQHHGHDLRTKHCLVQGRQCSAGVVDVEQCSLYSKTLGGVWGYGIIGIPTVVPAGF